MQTLEKYKEGSGMTKYEKIKLRIIIVVAGILITQAVVSIGSFLQFYHSREARLADGYENCISHEPDGISDMDDMTEK